MTEDKKYCKYCDKWLSRHLDLLEKLGFNKDYILTHLNKFANME